MIEKIDQFDLNLMDLKDNVQYYVHILNQHIIQEYQFLNLIRDSIRDDSNDSRITYLKKAISAMRGKINELLMLKPDEVCATCNKACKLCYANYCKCDCKSDCQNNQSDEFNNCPDCSSDSDSDSEHNSSSG